MGSVMMEENVVSAAGTTYCLNEATLCRLIRDSNFTPAQRNNEYNLLKIHDDEDSPDLRVDDWSALRTQRLQQNVAATQVTVSVPLDSISEDSPLRFRDPL